MPARDQIPFSAGGNISRSPERGMAEQGNCLVNHPLAGTSQVADIRSAVSRTVHT